MRIVLSFCFCIFTSACGNLAQKSSTTPDLVYSELKQLNQIQSERLIKQEEKLDEIQLQQKTLQTELSQLQSSIALLSRTIANQIETAAKQVDRDPDNSKSKTIIDQSQEGKLILGRVEWVWLQESQKYAKARIDTGANTSSIDAQDILEFERDGDKWVRFNTKFGKELQQLEAPLVKYTKIKQASLDNNERRPVVRLSVSIGSLEGASEFTLSNREKMLYPILIGRNFIQDVAVVDVSKKFIHSRKTRIVTTKTETKSAPLPKLLNE